jgi:hypothetical protein
MTPIPSALCLKLITTNPKLYFFIAFRLAVIQFFPMNYTGNLRHLRTHPRRRSSQKDYFHHRQHRSNTHFVIPGRPQLDVCQDFQEHQSATTTAASATAIPSGSQAKNNTPSVSHDDTESFQTKRRRLLQQTDWLGLEISAPIKVPFHSAIKFENVDL